MNKKKFRIHTLKRLLGYIAKTKAYVALAVVLMITSNLLALIGPWLSGKAIDAIGFHSTNFKTVITLGIWMVLFYIASSILAYLLQRVMIHISQSLSYRLRDDIFTRLTMIPIRYFDTHQTGDVVSRISYDVDTINTSLTNDVLQVLTSFITIFFSLTMMIMISPLLTLVFAITVPVTVVFTIYRAKKVRPLFSRRSRKLGELNAYCEEMLSGHDTIKAYSQQAWILSKFDDANEQAVNSYYEADYQGSLVGPSVGMVNNLSLSLIALLGALLYLDGAITLGSISTFILYSRKFSGPINEMANIFSEIQSALSAAQRIFALLDEPEEKPDLSNATLVHPPFESLSFDHVNFGYEPNKQILHDVSFELNKGETLAIVGATGAGKTTIINLIMRFYEIDDGTISLNGHPTVDYTRKSLRQMISMVLQDTWIFGGTVAENIRYGNPHATDAQVVQAAKAAHIHDFIMHLPHGYATVLQDGGANISKGQLQLLTIARAMLSTAELLILDEATSNVDSNTEQAIQAAMNTLMQDKTSIIIAHRLSTIQNADRILVLDHGRIRESGSHQSLLQAKGFYYKLYHSQFEGI